MLNTIVGMLSGGAAPTDYESIATTTVGAGGAASVTFSSIPSTYSHLQIRLMGRTNRAATLDNVKITFNSDTGANYKAHYLAGDGSTAYANVTSVSPNAVGIGYVSASTAFIVSVCDILDYANTNKY
jgi:hypothetical protein